MKEKIAEKLISGLDNGFSFDIGNVSAGVAKGYFDLKRFALIISYAWWAAILVIIISAVVYMFWLRLRSIKQERYDAFEDRLKEMSSERDRFNTSRANMIKNDVIEEMNKMRGEETAKFDNLHRATIKNVSEHYEEVVKLYNKSAIRLEEAAKAFEGKATGLGEAQPPDKVK